MGQHGKGVSLATSIMARAWSRSSTSKAFHAQPAGSTGEARVAVNALLVRLPLLELLLQQLRPSTRAVVGGGGD